MLLRFSPERTTDNKQQTAMDIMPEWAPNVHPMLVHFPIALLCTAVLLDAVALEPAGLPALFVFDQPLHSLQADLALNLDDFDGTLQIVHHVQGTLTYLFTEIAAGTMRQGRMQNGQADIMDQKAFAGQGWQQIRVVADRTHFRAYAGGTLVTHGHGPAPEPGPVGLCLDGTVTVLLGRIDV